MAELVLSELCKRLGIPAQLLCDGPSGQLNESDFEEKEIPFWSDGQYTAYITMALPKNIEDASRPTTHI